MSWRVRLVAVLIGCSAAFLPAIAPASAATSYWTIYNPPARSGAAPLCVTAESVGGWATIDVCDGSAAQDWAFSRGSVGEYLVNRARPGTVLAVSKVAAGGRLMLARRDTSDVRQFFVAGDPVKAFHNHIRPHYAPDLCLEAKPGRVAGAAVILARCDADSSGPQAWLSRFHGNY